MCRALVLQSFGKHDLADFQWAKVVLCAAVLHPKAKVRRHSQAKDSPKPQKQRQIKKNAPNNAPGNPAKFVAKNMCYPGMHCNRVQEYPMNPASQTTAIQGLPRRKPAREIVFLLPKLTLEILVRFR